MINDPPIAKVLQEQSSIKGIQIHLSKKGQMFQEVKT